MGSATFCFARGLEALSQNSGVHDSLIFSLLLYTENRFTRETFSVLYLLILVGGKQTCAHVCCQGWTLEAMHRILPGGGYRKGFLYLSSFSRNERFLQFPLCWTGSSGTKTLGQINRNIPVPSRRKSPRPSKCGAGVKMSQNPTPMRTDSRTMHKTDHVLSCEAFALTAALQGGEDLLLLPQFADEENQFVSEKETVSRRRLSSPSDNGVTIAVN